MSWIARIDVCMESLNFFTLRQFAYLDSKDLDKKKMVHVSGPKPEPRLFTNFKSKNKLAELKVEVKNTWEIYIFLFFPLSFKMF